MLKKELGILNKIETIQTQGKLNEVYKVVTALGKQPVQYLVARHDEQSTDIVSTVKFQNGSRNSIGSSSGVLVSDLLEICKHQLEWLQSGDFPAEENDEALKLVSRALEMLNRRVVDRVSRGVLGKLEK